MEGETIHSSSNSRHTRYTIPHTHVRHTRYAIHDTSSLARHTPYAIRHTLRASRGVTLLDTIVGSALMLVVFVGVAAAFQLSVDVVTNNKARAGAIALANERMEYIRSLPYASVGNVGSIPVGTIAQSEAASSNGVSYTLRTTIQYADDPADGLGSADNFPSTNPSSLDYKAVKVDVSWNSRQGARHVVFVTRVEPPNGVESPCPPNACNHIEDDKFEDKFEGTYEADLLINKAMTTHIELSGNQARIEGNGLRDWPGDLYSITITPQALSGWKKFSWNDNTPSNGDTLITYHIYFPSGSSFAKVPDSVLPGNNAGFVTSSSNQSGPNHSIDLSGISVYTYPSLVLYAHLIPATDNAPSPKIAEWELEYDRWI